MDNYGLDLVIYNFVGGLLSLIFGFMQALFTALGSMFGAIPFVIID